MSVIIEMLKQAKEGHNEIAIVTLEGHASYRITGYVKSISEEDVLIERTDRQLRKTAAIKISSIIKVED